MKQFLKQFMVSDTNSSLDVFFRTRIKLTAVYVLTVMFVVIFFSVGIFELTSRNIRFKKLPPARKEMLFQPENNRVSFEISDSRRVRDQEIRKDVVENMKYGIIFIDFIIFILVSVLGYIFSGMTLLPIKKSYMSQKRFIQDASHDLRTPLSVMRSEIEVEMLSTKKENIPMYTSLLEEIKSMSRLVEELFLLSTFDSPFLKKIEKKSVDMKELIDRKIDSFSHQCLVKNINFSYSIEAGFTEGNQLLIERSITNIFSNAVKYTEAGSISLVAKKEKNLYIVRIVDTGVGISKKDLPHVYDRFYKGDASRTHTSSSGLGLSIVKEILEKHGATISIGSHEQKGTEVVLSFKSSENKIS